MENKTIGNLPSTYVDSMSYYEAIVCIHNYINDEIIPTINNNAEISEEIKMVVVSLNKKCAEIIEYYETHVIPTKVSELENDVGYITEGDIPTKTSDLINDSGYITNANIPTKTSDLINDSGYITNANIPTKTSDLINDSGFVTSEEIYSKEKILYENASGSNTNITLNDNASNYKYLEIYYICARSGSSKILGNATSFSLSDAINTSSYIVIRGAVYNITGNTFSIVGDRTGETTIQTSGVINQLHNTFYIQKVVGYKE